MFKIIYELAMDPLGLPIEFYWEWLILVVIDQISYRIAFDKVGGMYNSGMISGSIAGSFFHFLIRSIYFVGIWAVTYAIIWLGKFTIAHKNIMLNILIGLVVIGAVTIIVLCISKHFKKND